MKTDLFISYAWTCDAHRAWVRLFASHLHLAGYVVKIDEAVKYGSSLTGFMREVIEAEHVILIVDENYVERANNNPASGVAIENKWISEALEHKAETWLSVIFVKNSEHKLPDWLVKHNPKGFDFNYCVEKGDFPGTAQIEAIWRWIEGLPADKMHALDQSTLRERAARLEHISNLRDPANYITPALKGNVTFCYNDNLYYTVGYGDCHFDIMFEAANIDLIRIYKDYELEAVWLLPKLCLDPSDYKPLMGTSRYVELEAGQKAALMNSAGILCVITIEKIQPEVREDEYVKGYVTFSYVILHEC
ncbi:toll/interleukin-1 receptor domain-containing protein [Erwinia psidii]|uniref:TIR domain-containing protein n=1 Tax=Erwinia psidii TaxID=69224 RepID=A0A3N6RXS7_9GAMM|nr:toll/interleukin-1 receptor domain-containing protein [Erwinia psidii]MCX8957025.1 TIR domain-containing protein [Erwinia psidii]MCX8965283.1 TIR domain-containing protein [Erwinia psidii]RQM37918.1 TIR domain-containing protein [Erwinia psidii]